MDFIVNVYAILFLQIIPMQGYSSLFKKKMF